MPVTSSGRSGGREGRGGEMRERLASRCCRAREAMDCQVGLGFASGGGEVIVAVWERVVDGRKGKLLRWLYLTFRLE